MVSCCGNVLTVLPVLPLLATACPAQKPHRMDGPPDLGAALACPAAGLTAAAMARLGAPPSIPDRILQREALKSCLYAWLAERVWGEPEAWLGVGGGRPALLAEPLLWLAAAALCAWLVAGAGRDRNHPPAFPSRHCSPTWPS
jgi:hypothetical protein